MVGGLLTRIFGTSKDREIKRIAPILDAISGFENDCAALTNAKLRAKTGEFKARLADGETLDDLLPEAFAVTREAAKRVTGMRPFDVQVLGGIVLHNESSRRPARVPVSPI